MKDYTKIIGSVLEEREKKEKDIIERAENNIEKAIRCFEGLEVHNINMVLGDSKKTISMEREIIETDELSEQIFEQMCEIVYQDEIVEKFNVASDAKCIRISLKA